MIPFLSFQLFELMNFLAENFVFLYIGVSVFTFENVKWNAWFILASFVSFSVLNKTFLCHYINLTLFTYKKLVYMHQIFINFGGESLKRFSKDYFIICIPLSGCNFE
jgi:hypothetical protein